MDQQLRRSRMEVEIPRFDRLMRPKIGSHSLGSDVMRAQSFQVNTSTRHLSLPPPRALFSESAVHSRSPPTPNATPLRLYFVRTLTFAQVPSIWCSVLWVSPKPARSFPAAISPPSCQCSYYQNTNGHSQRKLPWVRKALAGSSSSV
jgi:hypothetical protein